ncbi:MAG: 4Fe-4S binding protein, partial [Dethiobacteria bacterium]
MMAYLMEITAGRGKLEYLERLRELAAAMQAGSLCALGRLAPNPVLTTLRYFKDEYLAHIEERRCPAGVCRDLITYSIDTEACTACGRCIRNCPTGAISGPDKEVPLLDQELCIRCGACLDLCRFDAIVVQ